jgi:hypothetical protein
LVREPEGKIPLEKLECRWDNNIKMFLREIMWEAVDWIQLFQDRYELRTPEKYL